MLDLHFIRPNYLWLFIPAVITLVILWRHFTMRTAWNNIVDNHLLPHLLLGQTGYAHRLLLGLLALAWSLAIIALSGPSWERETRAVYRAQSAQVIVLDMSTAMANTDLAPSRLVRAKYKIFDLLKKANEGQIGMVVYTSEPYVVSPLTDDAATLSALIGELEIDMMPVQGHKLESALHKAHELVQQSEQAKGHVIVFTANIPSETAITTARKLNSSGVKVSIVATVAQGSVARGGPINLTSLKRLATQGGGEFWQLSNDSLDIDSLAKLSMQSNKTTHKQTSQQSIVWKDAGRYFILILLPLALLVFRRGWFEEVVR